MSVRTCSTRGGDRERLGEEPEPAVAWVDQTVWPTKEQARVEAFATEGVTLSYA